MMAELHEQLRRDLETLRERQSPPAGADARVLAAVEAIGFGPGGPSEPDPDPDVGWDGAANDALGHAVHAGHATTGAQLVWAAKIVAITLALTGAGLLGVGATARVIRASRASSSAVASGVDTTGPTTATADAALEPSTPAPTVLAEPPSARELEPAEPAVTERAHATVPGTPLPSPATEVQKPDPLAAELALIEAARTAVDAASALELLREHERRFADGLLATERELLIIEHLCELGQLESARHMFADHRDAPQRARLLELCPELGNAEGTDPRAAGHE
jgi:hypothetical protein